jgi:tetratricopeptide (TPR) repeat protein
MPPEQARGDYENLDERADIYALGAVLSSLLTCRMPSIQPGGSHDGRMLLRKIPPALAAVAAKAMSSEPGNRYQAVRELASDVQAFVGGYATSAQQASALTILWLLIKRHSLVAALFGVSLVLIISIVSVSLIRIHRSEEKAMDALDRILSEQESKRKIGLIAAPRVMQQAEEMTRALDYDHALQTFDYAVALDSELETAWSWKGALNLGRQEFDQAVEAFDHVSKNKTGDEKPTDKLSRLDQVARKYAAIAKTNGGALPHNKLAEFILDIEGAGQTGWWLRNATLGVFFQHQNRIAPDMKLIELALSILNPDAKDFKFDHQDYPDGYRISIKGAKVESIIPLAGLAVLSLDLSRTAVTDLKWLRDMPLTMLDLSDTGANELAPLNSISTLVELRLIRWQRKDFIQVRPLSQLERLVVARSDVGEAEKALKGHVRKPPVIVGE